MNLGLSTFGDLHEYEQVIGAGWDDSRDTSVLGKTNTNTNVLPTYLYVRFPDCIKTMHCINFYVWVIAVEMSCSHTFNFLNFVITTSSSTMYLEYMY